MTWIPQTKLVPPKAGEDVLEREGLLERLWRQVTTKRLTLISAEAGAGKTTLVASLIERHPEMPVAWIALDEEDNRPEDFLTLVVGSVSRILGGCTFNAAALLATNPEIASEPLRLAGLFINDVLDCNPEPFVLVLDDLHTIEDEACLAALDFTLAHLPGVMHVVTTTRRDPPLSLSRLRARGQLAEIRTAHLRFSSAETAAWLNTEMGLKLSDRDLALIGRQTEGWVTALRLLALSLQGRSAAERAQIIRSLNRGHRFIFDYLLDEVVRQLPAEQGRFLMETSILTVMTPTLCRAVTGREDTGQLLESLYRKNVFISRTEGSLARGRAAEPAYRYHALLRQALRRELRLVNADHIATLHRRAAAALGTSPAAAEHFLQAAAWNEAAELLKAMVRDQVELGTMPRQLVALIDRLPEAVIAERPWLRAAQGITLLQQGHTERGRPLLEEAAHQLADAGDELSQAYLLFNLSNVTVGADMATYLEQIGTVFADRGDDVPLRWQVNYHYAMMWKHLHASNWPGVDRHVALAVDAAILSDEPGAYYVLAADNFVHFFYSARAAAAVMRLKEALMARFPPDDLLARLGVNNILLCEHWYRGEPLQAERLALEVQGMSKKYGVLSWADVNSMIIGLYCQWMRDDLQALEQNLNGVHEHMSRVKAWNVGLNDILCWLAFVHWRRGEGAEARRFLPRMESYLFFERQRMNIALVRALVAGAEGDLVAADRHGREAVALQRTAGFTATVGAQLLLAVIYWQAGEQESAMRELDVALAEWQRRDMPGVVLQTGRAIVPLLEMAVADGIRADFARRCLEAFALPARPRPLFVESTGETLTPREGEVLELVIRGMTNPQIAESLVISESTVKTHVSKILAKLQVSTRTEAAGVARELGFG